MMTPAARRLGLAIAATMVAAACSSAPSPQAAGQPTEEVSAAAIPSTDATDGAGSSASPSESASPSASQTDATDAPTEPTDTDRARFVASYRPEGSSDLEHVQADVDGDGVDEIIFVYVRVGENVGHVDVAAWDVEAGAYAIVAGADGGVADRIGRVRIGDLNLDGIIEVALIMERGSSGQSASLWAIRPDRLVAQPARGGCWDGSTTFGVIGASLEDRDGNGAIEIHATCDDSPLPADAWSTDVYVWHDNAWRHDPTF